MRVENDKIAVMVLETMEGTWEEIARNSLDYAGHRVRLTILDNGKQPSRNETMLDAIRKVSTRTRKMPVSSNADTPGPIREARSGGMFGDDVVPPIAGFRLGELWVFSSDDLPPSRF